MIKSLRLQFGSSPGEEKLIIETTPVTIFVGPNNSGKSKLLTEIQLFSKSGTKNHTFKLIDDIDFFNLNGDQLDKEFNTFTLTPKDDERIYEDTVFVDGQKSHQVKAQKLKQILSDPNINKIDFCNFYLSPKTLKLDAINRISLINQQPLGNLKSTPSNNLAILFRDDDKRLNVRRIIYEAFSLYFVLDPTNSGMLQIRLSKTPPRNHQEEKSLIKETIDFHSQAQEITNTSDGVKAFTGIITSIIAGNPKVTILDEPEAFLHPSLSFKLGKEIATSAKIELNRLFVSTHSSNFLLGCIQSGAPINIVRLTFSNEIGTARILEKEKIETLMKDPLLRSTGVLNALFYKYVIITEGDSDRAFYQEINERLNQFSPEKSIQNCLFINAVGKDSIWKIIKPLREMGIPAVGIYDIDILKNEGSNWTNALNSSFVPEISINQLSIARSDLKNKFNELKINMKTDGGVDALPASDKEAANNLFNQLEEYGIFVVRKGELEHWLTDLKVNAHKSVWLTKVFDAMMSNPEDPEYIKPGEGDVWEFLARISEWMSNESRKGIPK
ncbi:MAG: ATP-binding protein [Saprospiraceae bacterium]|nr:ATP-binding protein [Saprospiraceae bacterium]